MKIKNYEEYEILQKDLLSREIFILYTFYGENNKLLKIIQQEWFNKKNIKTFYNFVTNKFEELELKNGHINLDNYNCVIRINAICDSFLEYEYIYNCAKKFFEDNKQNKIDKLKVYDYAFNDFFELTLEKYIEEEKEINFSINYSPLIRDVKKLIYEIFTIQKNYKIKIKKIYQLNDMLSDILDVLDFNQDNAFNQGEEGFSSLYSIILYYSSKVYFALLLRENIIYKEELEKQATIYKEKPLMDEEELRLSDAKLYANEKDELFYKTLKN